MMEVRSTAEVEVEGKVVAQIRGEDSCRVAGKGR